MRGYVMERSQCLGLNDSSFSGMRRKALENLRNVLELFRYAGFLYMDIRTPNIRFDKEGKPVLLDIDSTVSLDNPVLDCVPFEVTKYEKVGGKVDVDMQTVMFNNFTKTALDLYPVQVDDTGKKILLELSDPKPDTIVDHEYLIDHLAR